MTRVLIVDDKEQNLYYLQALLSGHGEIVDTARHGAEALVKARQAPPDLIVSDLLMPVMDGYTLLRHWKADPRLCRIPFVVYTATYTEAEDEKLALSLGADAFILKPAEPEEFLARVSAVRARVSSGSPNLPKLAPADENVILKTYSETLIRKLEEKTLQLQETNRALEQDIVERKAVEAALREREAEFRLLTETIPHIVWITRPDGSHTHFNHRWLEYTGLSLEHSVNEGWQEAIHPEDISRTEARWRQALSTGEPYDIEYRIRRADGSYHWMLGRALPLRDATGTILKWFGTCTDIDEMKRALSRIEEQAALLDQTQDAIIVRDLQHRVLYWNKGAENLYGWTSAEAVGRSVNDLVYRDTSQLAAAMETLIRHGQWSGEVRQVNRAGDELTIESRWRLLYDAHGRAKSVLAVNTDITERKKIEAQFLRAQRVESIGTLAGGIAHDLNNLLSPIIMAVGLLRTKPLDLDGQKLISAIESSAHRGTELVKQVLSFAHGIEGARVAVHPGHLLRELESLIRTTFPKNIAYTGEVGPDIRLVHGDPTQLNQVLLNLCVNARDAMPGGGRLHIRVTNTDLDEQYAAMHRNLTAGPYVCLEVTDTGGGIPREIIDRIFEPFFTTKEPGKGTGLGLSTVLGIVRSHGGTVSVDSEPGRGTTFRILLPAQTETAAPFAPGGSASPQLPHGQGQTILLVDDDATVLAITRQTLAMHSYRVIAAEDGAQAMALYAVEREQVQLVITDLMMPVMDGLALVNAVRRINPDIRVIAMTGLQDAANGARLAKAGVMHVLAKPYTAPDLLHLVARVLTQPK